MLLWAKMRGDNHDNILRLIAIVLNLAEDSLILISQYADYDLRSFLERLPKVEEFPNSEPDSIFQRTDVLSIVCLRI